MDLFQEPNAPTPVYGGKLEKWGETPIGSVPLRKSVADPARSWHYFHPGRVDRRLAPEHFRQRIKEVDTRFDVVWHPVRERWTVWAYMPHEIRNARLNGWKFIFQVEDPNTGAYVPLDERVLAVAWDRCGRKHGTGRRYWDRFEREFWRDKASTQQDRSEYVKDLAADRWDHMKIQVAMRGKSTGSKFSAHHAGG